MVTERGMVMPTRYTAYEPDQMDCQVMTRALGGDFGVIPSIETVYTPDQVCTIVRCRKIGGLADSSVEVQAMVRSPLRGARSLYSMHYSALLDCWHQLDRGVLSAQERPITRDWSGRPKQPTRRT